MGPEMVIFGPYPMHEREIHIWVENYLIMGRKLVIIHRPIITILDRKMPLYGPINVEIWTENCFIVG